MTTADTLQPGQRVVLRAGAQYAREQANTRAPVGGLSVTVTKRHVSHLPHAAYEWAGQDAHGRPVLFMAADAEIAGNLP